MSDNYDSLEQRLSHLLFLCDAHARQLRRSAETPEQIASVERFEDAIRESKAALAGYARWMRRERKSGFTAQDIKNAKNR